MEFNKGEDFSEWYSKVLFEADIVDIRYPVKGMPVYMPWGFRTLEYMFGLLERMLDGEGHDKLLFPVAIPQSSFAKESMHIKGFEGEVLWVTHGGKTKLEESLVLRPTSETSMYPMFALWIRSHADLPLKVYQTTAVYRHETKATRPLIRGREVYWNEGHSAHATYDEASMHVENIIKLYAGFFKKLCIPFKIVKRPEHDKFPGADYTYAFDTLMPDGKILQIATVHNLGENFSKPYEIKYCDENGKSRYASQVSYGISMRALAAVLSLHGDKKGLALPFEIAPVQVVLVPIYAKGNREEVDAYLHPIHEKLKQSFRCYYDDSDKRPGDKFYHWELKGVPLRIEAGMRDISEGKITLVDRLGNKRQVLKYDAESEIRSMIEEYSQKLCSRANSFFGQLISNADSFEKIIEIMESKRGFVKAGWCENIECAERLKENSISILGLEKDSDVKRECAVCGKNGREVLVGKSY